MFKKILSLMLVVLMLTLCCACNTGTENGTDDIPTAAPTDSTDDKGSESAAPEINIPDPDVPDGSILISHLLLRREAVLVMCHRDRHSEGAQRLWESSSVKH